MDRDRLAGLAQTGLEKMVRSGQIRIDRTGWIAG